MPGPVCYLLLFCGAHRFSICGATGLLFFLRFTFYFIFYFSPLSFRLLCTPMFLSFTHWGCRPGTRGVSYCISFSYRRSTVVICLTRNGLVLLLSITSWYYYHCCTIIEGRRRRILFLFLFCFCSVSVSVLFPRFCFCLCPPCQVMSSSYGISFVIYRHEHHTLAMLGRGGTQVGSWIV